MGKSNKSIYGEAKNLANAYVINDIKKLDNQGTESFKKFLTQKNHKAFLISKTTMNNCWSCYYSMETINKRTQQFLACLNAKDFIENLYKLNYTKFEDDEAAKRFYKGTHRYRALSTTKGIEADFANERPGPQSKNDKRTLRAAGQ